MRKSLACSGKAFNLDAVLVQLLHRSLETLSLAHSPSLHFLFDIHHEMKTNTHKKLLFIYIFSLLDIGMACTRGTKNVLVIFFQVSFHSKRHYFRSIGIFIIIHVTFFQEARLFFFLTRIK